MSTPFSSGERPHRCGFYIEEHARENGRWVCPAEATYRDDDNDFQTPSTQNGTTA